MSASYIFCFLNQKFKINQKMWNIDNLGTAQKTKTIVVNPGVGEGEMRLGIRKSFWGPRIYRKNVS